MITHYDLFAGIGGFSLALDNIIGKNNAKHIFVERDKFCQLVLKKHWQEAEYYSDINAFNTSAKKQSARAARDFTFLTGGFPCQPFSQAGRRKGTADDRYLWPAMFESIRLIQPDWIVAENVAGLVTWNEGLVLEQVCSDLEKEGYEVQSFIIPACAINAPHRRDRVWIIANRSSTGARGNYYRVWQESIRDSRREEPKRQFKPEWFRNWFEVATKFCRVDDGLPRRLDRNPRLKALGNAIVPQVAEEIFRRIFMTKILYD